MKNTKATKYDASHIFAVCHVDPRADFFTLTSSEVLSLLDYAGGYRKPKNANGSRGRCFHAHLIRLMRRDHA